MSFAALEALLRMARTAFAALRLNGAAGIAPDGAAIAAVAVASFEVVIAFLIFTLAQLVTAFASSDRIAILADRLQVCRWLGWMLTPLVTLPTRREAGR
jgi:hypothetical protein